MTERLTPPGRPPNWIWRGLQLVCLTFVWLMVSAPAHAEVTRDDLARRHFQAAKFYFEQGEYERALQGFEKAYDLSMRPEILVSISLTNEKMKRLEPAIEALDRFLVLAADHPDADTVRTRRNALRERLAGAPPPPPISQDSPKEREPPAPVAPPPPAPVATESPSAPPVVAPLPPARESVRWPAFLLLGTGGASLIGALTTGVFAEVEYEDLEERCAPRCTPSQVRPGRTMQTASRVLTGVGVVTLGVGAWLWWETRGTPQAEGQAAVTSPRLDIAVGERSGVATATWRF